MGDKKGVQDFISTKLIFPCRNCNKKATQPMTIPPVKRKPDGEILAYLLFKNIKEVIIL